MSEPQKTTAKGFLGNILKYSIATYLGFGISGLALVIAGILGPEKTAVPLTFMSATATLMNVGILGLDQSLLRFYAEPPAGRTGRQLFGLCVSLSALVMAVLGVCSSTLFPEWLSRVLSFEALGGRVVPLLFLNAAFYMVVRYLNVLLRLEGRVVLYTVETLLMQGCFNLFYLFAGFFTADPMAFALLAVVSFGVTALGFGLACRGAFRLDKSTFDPGAIKAMVPYGLALAPTQIMIYLNSTFSLSYLGNMAGTTAQGLFAFGVRLAQLVTTVQAGFSTFWGPFVFANYRTQRELIVKVHDYLCFLIFGFYCCLVAFEDVLFFIFPAYRACQPIFPVLMLNAVFTILCEGTVYGIAIAKRPVYDTIGIAVGAFGNIGLCLLLVPRLGLMGAALALALSGGGMFLFRTVMGQRFYPTIQSTARTAAAFGLAFAVTLAGVLLAGQFLFKGFACLAAVCGYLWLYRVQVMEIFTFIRDFIHKKANQ